MRARQLPLAAPKIDAFGLHAVECECARCAAGFRPTDAQRAQAKAAHARAAAAKGRAAQEVARDEKRAHAKGRAETFQRETEEQVRRLEERAARAAVPSDDEINQLRAMFGLRPRRVRR